MCIERKLQCVRLDFMLFEGFDHRLSHRLFILQRIGDEARPRATEACAERTCPACGTKDVLHAGDELFSVRLVQGIGESVAQKTRLPLRQCSDKERRTAEIENGVLHLHLLGQNASGKSRRKWKLRHGDDELQWHARHQGEAFDSAARDDANRETAKNGGRHIVGMTFDVRRHLQELAPGKAVA